MSRRHRRARSEALARQVVVAGVGVRTIGHHHRVDAGLCQRDGVQSDRRSAGARPVAETIGNVGHQRSVGIVEADSRTESSARRPHRHVNAIVGRAAERVRVILRRRRDTSRQRSSSPHHRRRSERIVRALAVNRIVACVRVRAVAHKQGVSARRWKLDGIRLPDRAACAHPVGKPIGGVDQHRSVGIVQAHPGAEAACLHCEVKHVIRAAGKNVGVVLGWQSHASGLGLTQQDHRRARGIVGALQVDVIVARVQVGTVSEQNGVRAT